MFEKGSRRSGVTRFPGKCATLRVPISGLRRHRGDLLVDVAAVSGPR